MFNFFKKKASSYLGLDLGTSSIKLVELENVNNRPRLVTYGSVEMESNVSRESAQADQDRVAETLVTLLQKTRAQSRVAVAALPNFSVFSSVIALPALSEKKLEEAVQWEAKKFIPMPLENVVLDWKVIKEESAPPPAELDNKIAPEAEKQKPKVGGNLEKCEGILRILLTAAPRHLVERYVGIFKKTGLELSSLETESFALSRSLIGSDTDPILIVDIGSLTTDLTIVEHGVPVLSRSIDVGGKTVTNAIASSMGISVDRAEQFKRDIGLGTKEQAGAQESGVGRLINQSFSPVINEMKYSLQLHQEQGSGSIKKILITGGSSFLPGLTEYLTTSLGIKAFIGNPWARVSYPKELAETLELIAPNLAIAIGLAMREIE